MSCIAGLLRTHGDRAAPESIPRMLSALKSRAPDGTLEYSRGPFAAGQALLRTGATKAEGAARLTLDGKVWLVADARVDGRADLLRKLRATGCSVDSDAPHGELILHAYAAFGDRFIEHLLGDFAFALWDEPQGHLICARDRFGVRPFYLTRSASELAFASDIAALLALPSVSTDLDEIALADFLLVGTCIDADRTIYRDVQCLPPATRLDAWVGKVVERRYWNPTWSTEIRYKSVPEYADHFSQVLREAVQDRVPAGAIGVPLSGGLDSTSIAAMAAAKDGYSGRQMTAYHISSRSLEPEDDEEPFARMVADQLGMEFVRQDVGDYPVFARSDDDTLRTSFPSPASMLNIQAAMVEDMERRGARVLLSGYAGDAVICPTQTYYTDLFRSGRWSKLASEMRHHIMRTRSLRGMGLRTIWRREQPAPTWKPHLPDWIDEGLAERVSLTQRWEAWWKTYQAATDTRSQLAQSWIHRQVENIEILNRPIVTRYPFLDLRVVEFVAGLPNFMRSDKRVLREAMRGSLPEAVRIRPKTCSPGDPVRKIVTKSTLGHINSAGGMQALVNTGAYEKAWQSYLGGHGQDTSWTSCLILQPVALANWLDQQQERKQ
jgi:asparagine synthase (glutamine-hydrolysing)